MTEQQMVTLSHSQSNHPKAPICQENSHGK
jgi:hypothetical protein